MGEPVRYVVATGSTKEAPAGRNTRLPTHQTARALWRNCRQPIRHLLADLLIRPGRLKAGRHSWGRTTMCGIVGAIAKRNVVPMLLEGLRRLEYRGYDSCGIAVLQGGMPQRVRTVERVA